MESIRIFKFLAFGLLAFALLGFSGAALTPAAQGASISLAPASYTTLSGRAGGQKVANLAVMDQSSAQDNPSRYVSFTTPASLYRGFRRYILPGNIAPSSVTSLQIKVNYKSLASPTQNWTWSLYDWTTQQWVVVGKNSGASLNRWRVLIFSTISPQRFIKNNTREIRVLLSSNNSSGDAKLDYESVIVGYNFTPTPTRTRTPLPTSSRTPTRTPGIPPTRTITPTPSATPSSVHFAVVGDYGINDADEAAVATLIKSWNPNFVITLGDNNYLSGDRSTIDQNIGKYYHEYIYPYTGMYGAGSPGANRFFPALGNHDWDSPTGAEPYTDYFQLPGNERYYDFGRGPVHFFVVDSDPREPDGTSSTSTQAIWLQNRLAAATEPWKIVYMHHPPYSSSSGHGSTPWMQWDFQGWGASAVLAGHDHTYERIDIGGFPYFVNGLGGQTGYGFNIPPVTGSQVRYNAQYGAMLVDATAMQITFQFIGVDGTVADTFTLPP